MGKRTAVFCLMLGLIAVAGLLAQKLTSRQVEQRAAVAEETPSPEPQSVPQADRARSDIAPTVASPDGAPSISGTVTYEDTGEPVAGVTVVLNGSGPSAKTDDRGQYAMQGIKPDSYVVAVVDPPKGFMTQSPPLVELHRGAYRADLTLYRPQNGSISGTVQDTSAEWTAAKFARVERAFEEARAQNDPHGPMVEQALGALCTPVNRRLSGVTVTLSGKEGQRQAVTRTDGTYTFEDVFPGHYELTVDLPEGAFVDSASELPKEVELADGEDYTGANFSLRFDSVTVTGRVVDESGAPLEGVEVSATRDVTNNETFVEVPLRVRTVSGKDGTYRLEGLLASQDLWGTMKYLGEAQPRNPELDMLVGGFSYALGASREGYLPLWLALPIVTEERLQKSRRLFRIFTKGTLAESPPYPPDTKPLPKFQGNTMTDVDFVMERSATLSGTLLDTQGNVITAGSVRLRRDEFPQREVSEGFHGIPASVEVDAQGRFEFRNVPPGVYAFCVSPAGTPSVVSENAPLSVKPGDSITGLKVIAELVTLNTVEGMVMDAVRGGPVRDFSVEIVGVEETKELNPSGGETATDVARPGHFRIEHVSAGLAALTVKADGYAFETTKVRVSSGQNLPIQIKLTPEAVVRVWVTRHGTSVVDANVSCTDEQGNPRSMESRNPSSPLPYYEFTGLAEGECTVAVAHSERWGRKKVKVEAGAVSEVAMELYGDSALCGSVAGMKGLGVCVAIYEANSDDVTSPPSEDALRAVACTSIPPGEYEVTELPPGRYVVVARSFNGLGAPEQMEQSQTVTLQDGEQVEASFDFNAEPGS